ncbi:MAG: hypothetical protein S4CHLAM102_06460 [Chlamydiia bacterium]|nr:hypothetical protein [Chlamydiia bacterium]
MHFSHLTKEYLPLLKSWFQKPHVAEYWHGQGLQNTLTSIDQFLTSEEAPFTHWIAFHENTPFGYLITAPYESNGLSVDLLIGDERFLGKGLGTQMIPELITAHFSHIHDIYIDPSLSNSRAIHVYEKVGFVQVEEFTPSWDPEDRCVLMHWKRDGLGH